MANLLFNRKGSFLLTSCFCFFFCFLHQLVFSVWLMKWFVCLCNTSAPNSNIHFRQMNQWFWSLVFIQAGALQNTLVCFNISLCHSTYLSCSVDMLYFVLWKLEELCRHSYMLGAKSKVHLFMKCWKFFWSICYLWGD